MQHRGSVRPVALANRGFVPVAAVAGGRGANHALCLGEVVRSNVVPPAWWRCASATCSRHIAAPQCRQVATAGTSWPFSAHSKQFISPPWGGHRLGAGG